MYWLGLVLLCLSCGVGMGQNLTADCQRDWTHYGQALTADIEWAARMLDANGRYESGTWEGNYVFEGDYGQCIEVRENQTVPNPVSGMYCIGTWNLNSLGVLFTQGLGYCIPNTCTDKDARELLDIIHQGGFFAPRSNTRIHCVRKKDISSDPGAIVSIVILSIFGAIVLAATIFDVIYQDKREKRKKQKADAEMSPKADAGYVKGGMEMGTTDLKMNGDIQMSNVNGNIGNGSIGNGDIGNGDMGNGDIGNGDIGNGDIGNGNIRYGIIGNGDIKADPVPKKHFVQPGSDNRVHADTENSSYNLEKVATNQEKKNDKPSTLTAVLLSFSLWTNVPALVSAKHHPASFKCLHGIRFLTMSWILLGHTYQLGTYITEAATISNRWTLTDSLGIWHHAAINEMWLAVETFFIMSAMLTTVSFMKAVKRQGNKVTCRQMALYYFHRYWRLTPVYMIILMIWTNLFYYFGAGPFFKEISGIETCKDIWWRHLLYIQNLFPKYIDCMGWTWYLANDFQFYVVAPLFIVPAFFFPVYGVIFMLAGYTGSLIANFVLYSQLYSGEITDQFTSIYVRPWTRANTYFLGLVLGWVIYRTKDKKIKIPKVLVAVGWCVMFLLLYTAIYVKIYVGGNAIYDPLQPTIYSLAVIWIIFACINGYGGIVNIILSWRFWIPLSRLTYTGYLIHPMVVYYFVYTAPKQIYYYDYLFIYMYFGNLMMTMLASFVVTLVFEIPMLGLEKVLIPKKKTS